MGLPRRCSPASLPLRRFSVSPSAFFLLSLVSLFSASLGSLSLLSLRTASKPSRPGVVHWRSFLFQQWGSKAPDESFCFTCLATRCVSCATDSSWRLRTTLQEHGKPAKARSEGETARFSDGKIARRIAICLPSSFSASSLVTTPSKHVHMSSVRFLRWGSSFKRRSFCLPLSPL